MSSVEKKHFGTLLKRDGSEVEVSEYSLKNSNGMVVEVKREFLYYRAHNLL